MTKQRGRLLAFFLALCLGLSCLPQGLMTASAANETYGMVINSNVKLRRQAKENSAYWFVLPVGWVCVIHNETNANGTHWYRVIAPHPEAENPATARTYWGYISDEYFRPLTETETAEYLAGQGVKPTTAPTATIPTGTTPEPGATAAPTAATGTTGAITNGGTNFREGPSKKYRSMMKLDRGTVVAITSVPDGVGPEYWYGVRYAGLDGYVNSEYIRVISGVTATEVTISPTATPTPAPGVTAAMTYNAVQLIKSSAHLRTSPGGSYNPDNDWRGRGSVLPLAGLGVEQGSYTWYPVHKDGTIYYVRNDVVKLVNATVATPTPAVTPTPTPASGTAQPTAVVTAPTAATPTPGPSLTVLGYVQTIKGGCNLRATIAGTTIRQLKRGLTLPYLSKPVQKNGYTWYYVDANGNRGYLRSDVVKVLSDTPTSGVTAAPQVSADPSAAGYVKTTATDVNLRKKAGYTATLGRVAKGTIMPFFGTPSVVNGVTWYHVFHSTYGYGYIHASYIAIVNADGSSTPTPVPTAAPTGAVITGTTQQQEATYTVLKLGSTGEAVRKLVQALKDRGYFSGSVINRYTTAVQTAVRAFQRAAGLSVDGIAGAATQHALYGTVPVGAAETSALTMTLYPAEKIDWWTGGINEMWVKGTNYKIYDVKTGIVWWAHRWSGGYHADIEPLTAADTARLCKAYGVTTSEEIKAKDLYQRRPSLITIGNRTFACSLYGVPHNYPAGDTIATNDFKGQACLHFTNSWTHDSKKVNSLHTEAIQYAWEHSPSGHK